MLGRQPSQSTEAPIHTPSRKPHDHEFDVCIIGTGGGGVMIDQLTAAGFEVVALEHGGRVGPADFDDDELREDAGWRVSGYPGPRHRLGGYTPGQLKGLEPAVLIWKRSD